MTDGTKLGEKYLLYKLGVSTALPSSDLCITCHTDPSCARFLPSSETSRTMAMPVVPVRFLSLAFDFKTIDIHDVSVSLPRNAAIVCIISYLEHVP